MRGLFVTLFIALAGPAQAVDLRGHGGPVGALAANGAQVLSGSFDTRAILWDRASATAERVLRVHDGAVTAVAFLPDGGLATGGQDGRVAIWDAAGTEPTRLTQAHDGQVAALAVSLDGTRLASAGWDGRVVLTAPDGESAGAWQAHQGTITGMGWLPDGRIATVGNDLRLRFWRGETLAGNVDLPAPPNALAVLGEQVAVAFADGALRAFGDAAVEQALGARPLVSIAAGEGRVAVASVDGRVWVLGAAALSLVYEIAPLQGPVWAMALAGGELLTAGGDGLVRRWDAATGQALGEGGADRQIGYDDGSPGAQVWRRCAVCHTLDPDDGNRAGPTLHGIFGRQIGTAPGYDYSRALTEMDLVWTPETVAELFEQGPDAYTPGSRMPEQRIPDPDERAALVEFLERATN